MKAEKKEAKATLLSSRRLEMDEVEEFKIKIPKQTENRSYVGR